MITPVESAGSPMMQLDELLAGVTFLELAGNTAARPVCMVTCDSREVVAGSLFVAVRGYCTDGHRFIGSAAEQGASVIICEEFPSDIDASSLYIKVNDSRQALAEAARIFYEKASERLLIIGVTGTNGKTTTAKLITAMLNANGIPAGYIGTNLCRIGERDIPLERTTPEAHGLHELFSQMVDAGCRAVVMEVSSHALVLKRVYGIQFHTALFTNLTMEHLDFHGTMEDYAAAKQLLFEQISPEGFAVFNIDDPFAPEMAMAVAPEKRYCATMQSAALSPLLSCSRVFRADIKGSSFASTTVALHFPDALVTMEVGLPGVFNVMNVLEAAAVGYGMGLAPEEICRSLSAVSSVNGRMERIGDGSIGWSAFVDYAHTPDALFKVLSALNALKAEGSRLVVVFGCGGNRDRSKRPEMGRIASENADELIITSDNPRDEDPDSILDEIERGITGDHYTRISDRAEAIRRALSMLKKGDLLLVAGKGHEQYQEIAGQKYFFSDQELIKKYLQINNSGNPEKESV